jgi:RNA recognition motif-containing protein
MFVSPHISKRNNDLTTDKSKQPINQNMTKNLNSCIFVRHIPIETSEEEIRSTFAPYGNILSIKLKKK